MKKPFLLLSLFAALVCAAVLNSCSSDEPEAPSGGGGEGETTAKAVDLGLSVRWASCNIGANAPYEAGGLYGWADPEGTAVTNQVHDENYNWTSPLYGGADPMPDICRTSYDLPHVQLKSFWRLPTEAEARELIDRCIWTKETRQGTAGYKVTGPNGNSIFLPMAGMRLGGEHFMQGQRGYYWTGTRQWESTGAVSFWVGIGNKGQISTDYRYQGCSIRPVFGTDSTTFTYDSPLDTVDRRVDMGVLSDSGKPLYWASGNLIFRRYARSYIAHEPDFVPEHRIIEDYGLECDLFCWGDATGRLRYYSTEWKALNVNALPDDISGDARYDIARAQLGDGWRLPTESEWQRLREGSIMYYQINRDGSYVITFTSRTTGNQLKFYGVGTLNFIDEITWRPVTGYAEFLTSGRNMIHFEIIPQIVDGVDRTYAEMQIWPNREGMLLVRPVTE
ncbi:MAG: hypothetical protein ACOYJE_07345 [Bacteroidaceae bacterium]|jgi:hypothetical protein